MEFPPESFESTDRFGSTAPSDPFELLGISPGAGTDEILEARNKVLLAIHPDKRAGSLGDGWSVDAVSSAYENALKSSSIPRKSNPVADIARNMQSADLMGSLYGKPSNEGELVEIDLNEGEDELVEIDPDEDEVTLEEIPEDEL